MGRSPSASSCGWIGPRRRRATRSRRLGAPWRRRCRARRPAPRPAGRRPRSMLQAAANAFRLPDVRRKLLFTFGILIIYRISAAIPVPSFDRTAFAQLLQQNNLFQLLSLFAGGSGQISIVMLGVYPYITAQIAIQILQPVIPRLEELMREGGEAGRQRLNQITRIVTVPLAMLQALGQGALLSSAGAIKNFGLFDVHTVLPTLAFLIKTATYLTRVVNRVTSAGALFLGAVALLPYIGRLLLNTPVNLTISATALLIIVGVVIDTMRQLEAQLMMRNYQSFIK